MFSLRRDHSVHASKVFQKNYNLTEDRCCSLKVNFQFPQRQNNFISTVCIYKMLCSIFCSNFNYRLKKIQPLNESDQSFHLQVVHQYRKNAQACLQACIHALAVVQVLSQVASKHLRSLFCNCDTRGCCSKGSSSQPQLAYMFQRNYIHILCTNFVNEILFNANLILGSCDICNSRIQYAFRLIVSPHLLELIVGWKSKYTQE